MTTVTGTFTLPSNDAEGAPIPDSGTVRFSLAASAVLQDAPPQIVTTADVVVTLDDEGSFSVDLLASDDPLWATEDDVPYVVTLTLSTTRSRYSVLVPTSVSDVDLADLVPLGSPPEVVVIPGPAPVITEGEFTAVPVAAGGVPTVDITFTPGDPGEYEVSGEFGVVTGADGADGADAADPEFTFSVSDVAPGGSATLDVTGTYPNLNLAFGVVEGAKGDTGSLAYWWRGAWVSGPYVEGDVVTHNGATWFCIADNTGLIPGAAPVTVSVGTVVQNGGSTTGTPTAGALFQPFIVNADRWITHVTVPRTDGAASLPITDSAGVVLATYASVISSPGVMAALSNPVQLLAGQTYYLGVDTGIGFSTVTASGIVGSLPGTLRVGTWDGTPISNRYAPFTLHGDSVESWVPLAEKGEKGEKGDKGDPGPTTDLTATATTLPAGSTATATVTGTPPNLSLEIGVPQGLKGDTGDVAPGNVGNLLTANQATGTGTLSNTTGFSGNPTLASSTDYAWEGVRSLKVTATSTSGTVFLGTNATTGSNIAVTPGMVYTAMCWQKSETITKSHGIRIQWFQADGTTASAVTAVVSSAALALSPTWTLSLVAAVAPSDAAFARVSAVLTGTGAGDVWHLDGFSFHRGAGGLWVPPGLVVPNLGTRANPSNSAQVQVWNPGNSTWITV